MGLSVIILAAGEGKRMRSSRPKVLHQLAGVPLLEIQAPTALQRVQRHGVASGAAD